MARAESPVNRVYSEHNATHLRLTDLQCVNCNGNTPNNFVQKVALAISLAGCFLAGHPAAAALLEDGKAIYGIPGPGTYAAPSSFRCTASQSLSARRQHHQLNHHLFMPNSVWLIAAATKQHMSMMLADRYLQLLQHGH